MSARQLIVLVIAAIAAIGALLLIRGMGASNHAQATAAKVEAPIAGQQVLVFVNDVPQGAQIKSGDLAWREFPNASVTGNFIRQANQSSAISDFSGAVTRRNFLAGEPLTPGMVVQPNNHGFMAAELTPGYRAVAVKIKPETAAGGFIQPNDHVDVILTTEDDNASNNGASNKVVNSNIVLEDVRVLALDDTVQTQASGQAPTRVQADVAVLELTPDDARALSAAGALGNLSLSLRSVEAGAADAGAGHSRRQRQGSIIVHAFGSVSGGGR